MVGNLPFFFLQFLMYIDIGDETIVVNGVESDVDLLIETVSASEGARFIESAVRGDGWVP